MTYIVTHIYPEVKNNLFHSTPGLPQLDRAHVLGSGANGAAGKPAWRTRAGFAAWGQGITCLGVSILTTVSKRASNPF